ncbi:MAG: molybdopterin molybdotransferase MoeA [Solirubrobacterales bacterium]|nr:molybdopterin molybdotransferase MoeA [Solirubrobacterales bacterium]
MTRPADVAGARRLVLDQVGQPRPESVDLSEASGRALFTDVLASHAMPPFASSAMDGYAALPSLAGVPLRVVGESRAGHPFAGELNAGEAIAISTGALAPDGVGVVPIEVVTLDDGVVTPAGPISAGDHVRLPGEDLPMGAVALTAGTVLRPAELSVIAACGYAEVTCAVRPRVSIVVTGDELTSPGSALAVGQIHESNGIGLRGLAEQSGAEVVHKTRCADTREATGQALSDALKRAEIVIASGGVSVGEHDHVRAVLTEDLGVKEVFWRVPLKPGGPTWFGIGPDGQLVFGLPGNPASAFVTYTLFVAPAIRALLGQIPLPNTWPAATAQDLPLRNREQAVRVTLDPRADGPPLAHATGAQGSHRTTSMAGAWGLALLPAGDGTLPAGSIVQVEPLPH